MGLVQMDPEPRGGTKEVEEYPLKKLRSGREGGGRSKDMWPTVNESLNQV